MPSVIEESAVGPGNNVQNRSWIASCKLHASKKRWTRFWVLARQARRSAPHLLLRLRMPQRGWLLHIQLHPALQNIREHRAADWQDLAQVAPREPLHEERLRFKACRGSVQVFEAFQAIAGYCGLFDFAPCVQQVAAQEALSVCALESATRLSGPRLTHLRPLAVDA